MQVLECSTHHTEVVWAPHHQLGCQVDQDGAVSSRGLRQLCPLSMFRRGSEGRGFPLKEDNKSVILGHFLWRLPWDKCPTDVEGHG